MKKIIIFVVAFIIIILIMFFISTFPVSIRIDDSIDLGNNYRYIQDYPRTIIHYGTKEYEGVGVEVIPPNILKYKSNKEFVIAKTVDIELKDTIFWILNKQKNIVKQYTDSILFAEEIETQKIDMTLSD